MVFLARGGPIPTPVICRVPPGVLGSNFDQVITRGRGGGILPKFYAGRFRPEVQSLALLYTISPFRIPSIDKCYPFPPKSLNPF